MKLLLCLALASASAFAQHIGDKAPSIPTTYLQTHPRISPPTSAFSALICNNGGSGGVTSAGDGCSMTPRYRTAAENWNSASPGGRIQGRYLIEAFKATADNGTPNAAYLAKIKALSYTGSACALPSAWQGNADNFDSSLLLALAYDWAYNSLGSAAQACTRGFLYAMMTFWENNYSGASPYSDTFYITAQFSSAQMLHLLVALAIYPDDPTVSLPHLRFSLDVYVNMILPELKQIVGADGYCQSSSDASNDCGGGYTDTWDDYEGKVPSMTAFYITEALTFAYATGGGSAGVTNFFTVQYPWFKNLGYWMLYETRPDFAIERLGDNSYGYLTPEYVGQSGADLGYMDGLAAIYNDPTLRGWSRTLNWGGSAPDGFEPSAWPFYTPDSSANSTNPRSASAPIKNFPGWGTIFMRTGWGEADTLFTIRYGDNFWNHPNQDTGAWTLYNRGPLAIRSGTYRAGSASPHKLYYAGQAISQNMLTVTDPSDVYNAEIVGACGPANQNCDGGALPDYNLPMPNDGGQRRVGSEYGNYTGTVPSQSIAGQQASPSDRAQWNRAHEHFHLGKLVAYSTGPGNSWGYAALDNTAAYNDMYSRNPYNAANTWVYNTANTSNRSFRVRKSLVQYLFLPRGTAAYVLIYNQVTSTNAAFVKKNLIHSVNAPVISGNAFTIKRTETVRGLPFANFWPQKYGANISDCPTSCASATQYIYNGALYGWMVLPGTGSLSTVGGPGAEFQVTDSNGTNNWNQCMFNQCSYGSIAGSVAGPYNITSGNNTLSISVDSGSAQTITLTTGSARTAAQVAADINAALTGAVASVQGNGGGYVALASTSNQPGGGNCPGAGYSSIGFSTIANSAYAALGFSVAGSPYCGYTYDTGFGAVGDYLHPLNTTGPTAPGSYRIEETTGTTQATDNILNVMLATSASDTNVVSTAPTSSSVAAGTGACAANLPGGCYAVTWKDNADTCTYQVTFAVDGSYAIPTIQGAGCATVIN